MVKGIKKIIEHKSIKWVGKFLFTIGLYILLSKIGSLITIQPGYLSTLWVPSGFAVGAVILFKRPATAAVLIAAFFMNLFTFSNSESLPLTISLTFVLTVQAVAGAEIIRKRVRLIPPDNVKDTIQVIAILSFTSFVTSIIGTLLLYLFNIELPVPPWLFATIWITGAMISSFTITPLLLPLYDRLRIREKRTQFIGVFSSLIISFTFLLVYITWITETDRLNSQFQEDSREIFSIINSEFQKEIESIQGIKAFFNASDFVERGEFSDFTRVYLENSESTNSLVWAPIVKWNELSDFEKQVQKEGFPDFKVFEHNSTFQKTNPTYRNVYYPITYFASEYATEGEMGFDLGSSPSLLEAINMAKDIGDPISTEPINLHLSQSIAEGIYVIVPIYGKQENQNKNGENTENLMGFGVGNFDVDKTITNALSSIKEYDITIFLFDMSDSRNPTFISHFPHTDSDIETAKSQVFYSELSQNLNAYQQDFEIFGRSWKLVGIPGRDYSFKFFPNYSLMVLLIGLTLLIAYLINSKNNETSAQRIRKSESMFRSLSDSALTGIIRFRPNGEILYTNDALAKIFGFEDTIEFYKTNFINLFDDPREVKALIDTSKDGTALINKQFKIKHLNGNSRDILVSAGVFEGMISANVVDITSFNKLNKEVQQLNHAIRQMADTVFITDKNGTIEYVNPAFEFLTGFSYNDCIGKDIKQIKKSINDEDKTISMWESLLDGKSHEFEFQTRLNNYEIITEFITISPITDSSGNIFQYIASGKDITDLKRAREEILDLNSSLEKRVVQRTAELEKAKKEMEAFSYTVSHDLRAPLRNMHGYSTILLEDFAKTIDATGLTYLQHIQEASIKMDSLIQDLLKLSHISNSACVRKKVDLAILAHEIFNSLIVEFPERNVSILIPESIIVYADANLMSIALTNLIRNAWKFTKNQDNAIIELGSLYKDKEQVIFVRDNGAGFDMAYQNKLFGVFQRLHRDSEFEGTGIGLATVKRIIDHHEGRVWAEGEIGKGATFFFTIGNAEE